MLRTKRRGQSSGLVEAAKGSSEQPHDPLLQRLRRR